MEFTGIARVFDEEDEIFAALERNDIPKGSVVVVRYQGPKGGPGMPEVSSFLFHTSSFITNIAFALDV